MAYRMTELTPTVRVGRMSSGDLDIEVWPIERGWNSIDDDTGDSEPQEIVFPADAVDALFEYLR